MSEEKKSSGSNDLSDEAFHEYVKQRDCEYTIDIWRECRRRAEAMMEAALLRHAKKEREWLDSVDALMHDLEKFENRPCWNCGATKEIK